MASTDNPTLQILQVLHAMDLYYVLVQVDVLRTKLESEAWLARGEDERNPSSCDVLGMLGELLLNRRNIVEEQSSGELSVAKRSPLSHRR